MSGEPRSKFELRLADALHHQRPLGGAPATLVARIGSMSTESRRRRWMFVRALRAGAAFVTVAALVFIVAPPRTIVAPPTGPGTAPTATFDPMLEGPGIVREVVPWLLIVPSLLAIAIGLVGIRWAARWRWHGLVIRLGLIALAVAPLIALTAHPGFEMGSASGPRLGFGITANGPPGAEDVRVYYETAQPGGPIMIALTIRNPGPLPIRVEGLVEPNTGDTPLVSRWTALWIGRDPRSFPSGEGNLESFKPVTVQPGQELEIGLVGIAGNCAFGPGYTLDTQVSVWAERSSSLTFAYSVLGLQSASQVEFPARLLEPYRDHCS